VDAVIFSAKRVHLTLSRVGRRLLKAVGLTPARFEMLSAVDERFDPTQKELCVFLGLARATVCEMLQVLEGLGLVRRYAYRRTMSVSLTPRGEKALGAAHRHCINNGTITCAVDAAIAGGDPSVDTEVARDQRLASDGALRRFFCDRAKGFELHRFDSYENLGWFAWTDDEWPDQERLPFVNEIMLPFTSFSGTRTS
jgi:DNA-binding MarR family transcriptional regulator